MDKLRQLTAENEEISKSLNEGDAEEDELADFYGDETENSE